MLEIDIALARPIGQAGGQVHSIVKAPGCGIKCVGARATVGNVNAQAGKDIVIAIAAILRIRAAAAAQRVIAITASDCVGARRAGQRVVARTRDQMLEIDKALAQEIGQAGGQVHRIVPDGGQCGFHARQAADHTRHRGDAGNPQAAYVQLENMAGLQSDSR